MINVLEKKDCCGCSACATKCPKHCITMLKDEKGFLYPNVDKKECVDCGLCETVCPLLNKNKSVNPIHVYAAQNVDESVRLSSSSGGVFLSLAEQTIDKGGIVFGASFDDNWNVCHRAADSKEGILAFQGSKYVQSKIGGSYRKAKEALIEGKEVLFSGTPCQIAGLKKYLGKEYDNLLTVDVICHGVPSPNVWSAYINSIKKTSRSKQITAISFRDKSTGWQNFGFTVFSANKKKPVCHSMVSSNIYMRGFLQNLYLRPSCYHCQFRNFKSSSDVTLADLWGIKRVEPRFDDDKGTSLIIDKTGKITYPKTITCVELSGEKIKLAYKGNSSLFNDEEESSQASLFWKGFISNPEDVQKIIKAHTSISRKSEVKNNIDSFLIKLNLYRPIQKLVRRIKYGK